MRSLETRILGLSAALGLYDRWAARHLPHIHNTLLDLAHLQGNETTLDIGCGTGHLVALIRERCPGGHVRGIDPSPSMIRAARYRTRRSVPPADFSIGRASGLPYDGNTFNVVFSCLVLHLLDRHETERTLREIRRVLKPQGRYISIEFHSYPRHWLSRRQAAYPRDLLSRADFSIIDERPGPSLTRRHHATYRTLTPVADR